METLVKVGIVPGTLKDVVIDDEDMTIREIFALAEIDLTAGYSVRVNGSQMDLDASIGEIEDNTTIYATKMIKGN